jgi:hypothetical protein
LLAVCFLVVAAANPPLISTTTSTLRYGLLFCVGLFNTLQCARAIAYQIFGGSSSSILIPV